MAKERKKPKPAAAYPPELAPLLAKLPARDVETGVAVCREILAGGSKRIEQLVGLVGNEFGAAEGVKPKYALHGTVVYAGRPDGGRDRRLVAGTLAGQLASAKHSDELKAFLCRQLQLCGGSEEIAALAELLGSDRLCEPAAQALQAIGGDRAAAALRDALPNAADKRRVTLLTALGFLADAKAAPAARQAARDADRDVRLAAFYVLASCGDGDSAAMLRRAAIAPKAKAAYERIQATEACLRLHRRQAAHGQAGDAAKGLREILTKRTGSDNEDHAVRSAALHDLAMAAGVEGVPARQAGRGSDELRCSVPAARTALKLARRLWADHRKEAETLLRKARKVTGEEAVLVEAKLLLGQGGA